MKTVLILLLSACACVAQPTNQDYKIMIPVVEQTPEGEFRDALYMTKQEWKNATAVQIQALKTQRKTNWLAFIARAKQPRVEPVLTEEELIENVKAQELQLAEQAKALDALKARLSAVISKRIEITPKEVIDVKR